MSSRGIVLNGITQESDSVWHRHRYAAGALKLDSSRRPMCEELRYAAAHAQFRGPGGFATIPLLGAICGMLTDSEESGEHIS